MGNVTSHTASFLGGSALAAAILGILTTQFHIDTELASDWLIVAGAILGGPVLAYLTVKAQKNPALAAALAALNAINAQNGHGSEAQPTVSAAPGATVVTNPVPEPAPAAPPPAPAPVGNPI